GQRHAGGEGDERLPDLHARAERVGLPPHLRLREPRSGAELPVAEALRADENRPLQLELQPQGAAVRNDAAQADEQRVVPVIEREDRTRLPSDALQVDIAPLEQARGRDGVSAVIELEAEGRQALASWNDGLRDGDGRILALRC